MLATIEKKSSKENQQRGHDNCGITDYPKFRGLEQQ